LPAKVIIGKTECSSNQHFYQPLQENCASDRRRPSPFDRVTGSTEASRKNVYSFE